MAMYILFVKKKCCYCIKAEKLLQEKQLQYKKVLFEEDQKSVLNEIKDALDYKTVPMIFKRLEKEVKFIGGYSDLENYLDNG
jgi:glutaredoxin